MVPRQRRRFCRGETQFIESQVKSQFVVPAICHFFCVWRGLRENEIERAGAPGIRKTDFWQQAKHAHLLLRLAPSVKKKKKRETSIALGYKQNGNLISASTVPISEVRHYRLESFHTALSVPEHLTDSDQRKSRDFLSLSLLCWRRSLGTLRGSTPVIKKRKPTRKSDRLQDLSLMFLGQEILRQNDRFSEPSGMLLHFSGMHFLDA